MGHPIEPHTEVEYILRSRGDSSCHYRDGTICWVPWRAATAYTPVDRINMRVVASLEWVPVKVFRNHLDEVVDRVIVHEGGCLDDERGAGEGGG